MCETVEVIKEINIMKYQETNHGQCEKYSEDMSTEEIKQMKAILAEASF